MISARELSRCIDNLAEINANLGSGDTNIKRLILEIGYILKQELDTVSTWNNQIKQDRNRGIHDIDVRKLLEDNNQLFNENAKLQELNLKLKEVIDKRIPLIENSINNINHKFNTFSEVLSKV